MDADEPCCTGGRGNLDSRRRARQRLLDDGGRGGVGVWGRAVSNGGQQPQAGAVGAGLPGAPAPWALALLAAATTRLGVLALVFALRL